MGNDVYVACAVQAEARMWAREAVAGRVLGGLTLEPQDVEVLSKPWLAEYFLTRDVTMNEVRGRLDQSQPCNSP